MPLIPGTPPGEYEFYFTVDELGDLLNLPSRQQILYSSEYEIRHTWLYTFLTKKCHTCTCKVRWFYRTTYGDFRKPRLSFHIYDLVAMSKEMGWIVTEEIADLAMEYRRGVHEWPTKDWKAYRRARRRRLVVDGRQPPVVVLPVEESEDDKRVEGQND